MSRRLAGTTPSGAPGSSSPASMSSSARNGLPPVRSSSASRAVSSDLGCGRAADREGQPGQLVASERDELQPLGPVTNELGDGRPDRRRQRLVGAERDDEGRPAGESHGERPEEVEGRGIGPLEVLDRQQQRVVLGQAVEPPGDGLEQPQARHRVVGRAVSRPARAARSRAAGGPPGAGMRRATSRDRRGRRRPRGIAAP